MTRRSAVMMLGACLLGAPSRGEDPKPIRVIVWDERQPAQKEAYENFLGNAIADDLGQRPGLSVRSVTMDDPDQGLSDAALDACDVLVWWGHVRQKDVKPETVSRVIDRVKAGKLGLVALHSAHWSRPFIEAMRTRAIFDAVERLADEKIEGYTMTLVVPPEGVVPKRDAILTPNLTVSLVDGKPVARLILPNCVFPAYRGDGKPSHVRVLKPDHPLAAGLPATFDIPATEMYSEPFHVPEPDVVVLEETWDAGERFRSLCAWKVGEGRVVYFRPGHETYPVFKQAEPLKVVENAVRWLGTKP